MGDCGGLDQEDGERQKDKGCNLRVESKGLEIKIFGRSTWVGGDSISQD